MAETLGDAAATADQLMSAAAARTGFDDFGDDWFHAPLAAWVADLADAGLNDRGRRFFTELAIGDLARRLRVLDVLRRNPEIAEVPIPPIVYITGLARSGTTLLHNLLALHDQARAVLRWEMMEPVPPPEAATYRTDPRIAKVQATIDKRRGTDLERMHWVNADEPEECVWAFIDFVSLLGGAASASMPRWGEFYFTEDHTPAFQSYRRILQLLLWHNPPPDDSFLVLKAPQIAPHVREFAAVFPEARFVVTDRDPYRTLQSTLSLLSGLHTSFVDDTDALARRLLRQNLDFTSMSLAAINRYDSERPRPALHVPYPTLVEDPAACAVSVFDRLGIDDDRSWRSRIDAFLAAQRSGARLAPPTNLRAIAMSADDVRAQSPIADYCRLHEVQPEATRLTGAHP